MSLDKSNLAPTNIQEWYECPFSILSHDEGNHYERMKKKEIMGNYTVDRGDFIELGIYDRFMMYLRMIHFETYSYMNLGNNINNYLEILVSVQWKTERNDSLVFRHKGKCCKLTREQLHRYLWFSMDFYNRMPYGWDPLLVWTRLTDKTKFNPNRTYSRWFKDPCIIALHFYLKGALFVKPDFEKVSVEELYVLNSILDKEPVDCSQIMMDAIMESARNPDKLAYGVRTMANLLSQVARMPCVCDIFSAEDDIHRLCSFILYCYGFMDYNISETRVRYHWKLWNDRVVEDLRREREEEEQNGRTKANLRKKLKELSECAENIPKEIDNIGGILYNLNVDLGKSTLKLKTFLKNSLLPAEPLHRST